MCRGMIGKKLGMTGIFSSEGKYVPVTVLKVGPCVVTQVKVEANDGYNALQVGVGEAFVGVHPVAADKGFVGVDLPQQQGAVGVDQRVLQRP